MSPTTAGGGVTQLLRREARIVVAFPLHSLALLTAGCATYRFEPLDADPAMLAASVSAALSRDAASIRRPLLAPRRTTLPGPNGVVTELAIFYLAEIEPGRPVDASALRGAGAKRLRPILMSALIAILTLSPLALGFSRGDGLQQPRAPRSSSV